MTSNQALQTARRLLNAAKAGHTGTLDPLATGLLPLCFGEATKVSQFLLGAHKTYRARARLGITTSTGDSEGEALRERPVAVDEAALSAALAAHTGDIQQVPPMHSALKQGGQRLYELARRGETVERPARPVHIGRLELLRFEGDAFEVDIDCSKGTYVRSLIEDIGEMLGCGAHLIALRRLRVGALDLAQAVDLDMAAVGWKPTVDNFLGRVTKGRILQAVAESKGQRAAESIEHLKKGDMAVKAEALLADSRWLPEPLRTPGHASVGELSAASTNQTEPGAPEVEETAVAEYETAMGEPSVDGEHEADASGPERIAAE
jgi:tRNA pseudouridine55 synthase